MHKALTFSADSGIVSGAIFIASSNCDERPDASDIDTLVIHAISLPPNCYGGKYVEQLFTNKLDVSAHPYFLEIADFKVSSHFYINRQGELVQFVSTLQRAWHAGKSEFQGRSVVNDFSIGIELEGCDDDVFDDAQYEQLLSLTACLQLNYPAITHDRIIGHSDIAPGRKTDPGPYFDWQRFRSAL